jgi:hypothetical protein
MVDKKVLQGLVCLLGMDGHGQPGHGVGSDSKEPPRILRGKRKSVVTLGEEAGKIKQKMMKYVTKQEQKTGWFQKELSYIPVKKEE